MRTQTIIILLSWLWVLATGTSAGAALFSGSVINKTTGRALADYPVTVWVRHLNQSGDNQQKMDFRTDQNGHYEGQTDGLPGKFLVAEVNYRGISYYSAPAAIDNDSQSYKLEVKVFEITNKRDTIHLTSRRMILIPKDHKTLEIDDLLQVDNSGAKTYVGAFNDSLETDEVLYIPMPKEYLLIAYQTEGEPEISRTGNAIITRNELPPGQRTISMRYVVRSDTGHFDLSLLGEEGAPKAEKFVLYVPTDSSWTIAGGSLKGAGSQLLGNTLYDVLQGKPGIDLQLAASSPSANGGFGMLQVSLVTALILPAPVLLLFRRRLQARSLRQEGALLGKLQKKVTEETQNEELNTYYQPLLKVLRDRSETLAGIDEGQ